MKDLRRPAAHANGIRLKRSTHEQPFVVVEGETDKRFWVRFLAVQSTQIVVASGREGVERVIAELDATHTAGVLGLIDADFDHLDQRPLASHNLVRTEVHDLDLLLFRSHALGHVLYELGATERVERQRDLRERLLEAARPIGALLRWGLAEGLAVDVKPMELKYHKFFDGSSLSADHDKCVEQVAARSQLHPRRSDMYTALRAASAEDPWQLCRGHDVAELLALALRGDLGNKSQKDLTGPRVEGSLRMACSEAVVRGFEVWAGIVAWQARQAAVHGVVVAG